MGQGVSAVLTLAVGVAVSPVPIIAVILMLFSQRARVNGPAFLVGWVLALVVVSSAVYLLADAGDVTSSSSASDAVSWGKIVVGALFVVLGLRTWLKRPRSGDEPEMPKWMSGIDRLAPGKAFGLGVVLAGVNPKNLLLTIAAALGLAQLGLSSTDVVVSLAVFVVVASLTIIGPVLYYFVGGDHAKTALDELKDWLGTHNAAVMTVLFLVIGADLIAKGLPPLGS